MRTLGGGARRRWSGLAVAGVALALLSGCIVGETGDARAIADESATLHGRLFSNEPGTGDVWFEYGTTTAYGQSTERVTRDVQDESWVDVSQLVEGLAPGTTYHYRLCGEGGSGPAGRCGADRSFTTGVGRVSVRGAASYGAYPNGEEAMVDAAADPAGSYLDGRASYLSWVQTPTHPPQAWGGEGPVTCLRVAGNVAVVGTWWNDPILGAVDAWLAIEDNGPTDDRFLLRFGESGCPAPSPSLFPSTLGPVTSGDLVIDAS